MRNDRPGRVVVGVDTTLSGLHALRRAVLEARARGTALHAVRAWTPAPPGPGPGPTSAPSRSSPGLATDAAALVYRAFVDTMGGEPPDVEVQTVVVPDSPGPVLVEYACRDEDLLVIGTGSRGLLRRLFGSAVVRYCVTRASCPVLVVPPPPLTRDGSPRALLRELRREIDQLADRGDG